ncbi:hypothetical protein IG631_04963 [Alternaria alternata]|nr:hypothetical protein IG631_04963 [Alternaria alternata]
MRGLVSSQMSNEAVSCSIDARDSSGVSYRICLWVAVPQVLFDSGIARLPISDQVSQHDLCSFGIPEPLSQGYGTSRHCVGRLYVHSHADATYN